MTGAAVPLPSFGEVGAPCHPEHIHYGSQGIRDGYDPATGATEPCYRPAYPGDHGERARDLVRRAHVVADTAVGTIGQEMITELCGALLRLSSDLTVARMRIERLERIHPPCPVYMCARSV